MRKPTILMLCLLLSSSSLALAQEDPCASTSNLDDYFIQLTERISNEVNGRVPEAVSAATDGAEAMTANQLASRANADGFGGSRLDLLHRAFVALGLGQVSEEEGQLVFNFNPESLHFDDLGQFSPRVIVHEPVLFAPLEERFGSAPDTPLQARQKSLEDGLGELDDVEARVRWTREPDTPLSLIQDMANAIFEPAYQRAAEETLRALANESAAAQQSIDRAFRRAQEAAEVPEGSERPPIRSAVLTPVSELCAVPGIEEQLLQLIADLEEKGSTALTDLRQALDDDHFFDLADLIDGEPRLTAEGSYRRREDAAGPDERSLSVRYEIGSASYRGFKKWAQREGKALDAVGVQDYLEKEGRQSIPKFSLTLDYSSAPELRIPLVAGTPDFVQPDAYKISGIARGGWYLGGPHDRNRRLEFEATYDDVTDDPARQDRLVGRLSWVEKLNAGLVQIVGGSDVVVTLVYADKPEFRGEVDEELGLRFGLKWSFGDGNAP